MTCPVCGAGIHPKDRFCGACGADVVAGGAGSGSLFDELMPDDDRHTAPTPAQGYAVPDDGGYGDDGADDGWSGHGHHAQEGRYEPAAGYRAGGPYPDVPTAPRDEGPSRGSVLLPLVILVVVVLAAIFAWQLAPRGGGDSGRAAGTSSTQDTSGGQPSESGGESTPSGSASESGGPQSVEMASGAKRCKDVGGAVAYRGNSVTSCDFAVEVAKALQDGDPDLPATVTARSPVTKKKYAMQCEDTAPVTCRGGNDALVYVDRG